MARTLPTDQLTLPLLQVPTGRATPGQMAGRA